MSHVQIGYGRNKRNVFSMLLLNALMVCAVLAVLSCQGPAGATGATGLQGPAGVAGPSAQTTNITVAVSEWRASGAGTPGALLQSGWKTAANITQSVMTSGVVLVYMQMETNPATWQQLPITFYGSSVFQVIDAQYRVGQVQVFINQSSTVAPPTPTGTITFRVVAIAGTTVTALAAQMDITNYQSVKKAFNLTE